MKSKARLLVAAWIFLLLPTLPAYSNQEFCNTFEFCREHFQTAASKWTGAAKRAKIQTIEIPSRLPRGPLPVELLEIPATATPRNLVFIISGVHGAEAFAGSTLQTLFLDALLPGIDRSHTTFVVVHIVNPYGAVTGRRVTEGNVDLNRNFSTGSGLYKNKNSGYAAISDLLNPAGPATNGLLDVLRFYSGAAIELIRTPLNALRSATLEGQYETTKGIFFGGQAPEPIVTRLVPNIMQAIRSTDYERMLVIDLHTGYGAKGFMHVMPNPLAGSPLVLDRTRLVMKDTLGGYRLEDVAADPNFYQSTGDLSSFIAAKGMAIGMPSVPLLLEFGTMDSQTVLGSLRSLYRVTQENRLHWYGADSLASKNAIQRDFREMFLPTDPEWQQLVTMQFKENLPGFIERFQKADR